MVPLAVLLYWAKMARLLCPASGSEADSSRTLEGCDIGQGGLLQLRTTLTGLTARDGLLTALSTPRQQDLS